MDGFWRYRPLTDRWLTGGLDLYEVPGYFMAHDFPYKKRPYAQEVLFADHLILVRMMGGWNLNWTGGETNGFIDNTEADFAYYNAAGNLAFRRHLIEPRLRPYVDNGYEDFTIVLDNTPWSLSADPIAESYGNAAPPQYPSHFHWGVRHMIQEIRARFGNGIADRLRFRMGTEYQTKERFSGTQSEYERLYDFAADAVRKELPEADFFPFNVSGPSISSIRDVHNINIFDVADHCVNGINSTGGAGSPFTNFPMSLYFNPIFVDQDLRRSSPKEAADSRIEVWNTLADQNPGLIFKRSVHEFGVIDTEYEVKTNEPGARGAAQCFEVIVRLLEGGLDELAHWDVTDLIPKNAGVEGGTQRLLLNGLGWICTIFDFYRGAEAYSLPVTTSTTNGSSHAALLMKTASETAVLVSSFQEDRRNRDISNCSLVIPADLLPQGVAMSTSTLVYDEASSIHDWLRQAFDEAGILDADYAQDPQTTASVFNMAGGVGRKYVRQNWTDVEQRMIDSLTLDAYEESLTFRSNGDVELSFPLQNPSLRLIVFRKLNSPKITRIDSETGNVMLTFAVKAGQSYQVQSSQDMATWDTWALNVPAGEFGRELNVIDDGTYTNPHPKMSGQRFYRLMEQGRMVRSR